MIPTDLMLRLFNATPEEYAAVRRILRMGPEDGRWKAEDGGSAKPQTPEPEATQAHEDYFKALASSVARIERNTEAVRGEIRDLRRENAKRGGPMADEPPISDDEARRLFALLKALESESNYRKAPVTRVFQLYCLEGLTRNKVAKQCSCAPSLITLRLQAIEAKLGRKASELRQVSGHFEQIAESLTDDRAPRIHRASALDQPEDED